MIKFLIIKNSDHNIQQLHHKLQSSTLVQNAKLLGNSLNSPDKVKVIHTKNIKMCVLRLIFPSRISNLYCPNFHIYSHISSSTVLFPILGLSKSSSPSSLTRDFIFSSLLNHQFNNFFELFDGSYYSFIRPIRVIKFPDNHFVQLISLSFLFPHQ
jgi:hypothetical protein